ncbi:MAG: hydroxymethylbilane synthase [Planctomycetes bacterium]|nr:hydroxymethylbilane synthase [Planctomycetota bacterium]
MEQTPAPQQNSSADRPIRVGTRASLLARTQTGWVVDQLRRQGLAVEIETIATQGDRRTDVPIATIGGDGVFVRELERALFDGRIDAAVHSLKDLPTAETSGLTVACVPVRAMPFDVLVGRELCTLESLRPGAVVGTSSVRRIAQVKALRSDLIVRGIRGNVDTRLSRLDAGDYDCLILAGAGLERLGLAGRITQVLRPDAFWPAVSQGALGIQIRHDDRRLRLALAPLDDPATHQAVRAERSCLAALAGGCLAPIGAWGRLTPAGLLELGACVLEDSGNRVTRITAAAVAPTISGEPLAMSRVPEALGLNVAGMLLAHGAEAMLANMRTQATGG